MALPPLEKVAALVLAAGKGTRMRSSLAKVLHPLCGRPLIWFPVQAALEAGVEEVIVVVGHQGEAVEAALRAHFPEAPLRFVEQLEQRGTGHAVSCATEALQAAGATHALIMSGDVPLLSVPTLQALATLGAGASLCLATTFPPDPSGYGRIVRGGHGEVEAIVEHRDASPDQLEIGEINAGLYLIATPLLYEGLQALRPDNAQGELYLTDLVAFAAQGGELVDTLQLGDYGELAGVNDRAELAEAAWRMRGQLNDALMRAGVQLEDPSATYVDIGVELAPDASLGAGVHLRGQTQVAEGAVIGPFCVLTDTTVGPGATVHPHSVLEGATLGAGASVGPFARLRPGTTLGPKAKVGNFVEVKNSALGEGAKANHLSYLGDATVGAGANVGAGTITCNYDGAQKHPTTIGAGAFIGSNSSLVAPIVVGEGAYVGAGSTLTQDVPDGALGVGRARQRTLSGWRDRQKG